MNRRTRRRAKRFRNTVSIAAILVLLVIATFVFTARTISAGEAEGKRFKYYTSVTIEDGDTLWSIAEEHISSEYSSMNEYMKEVQTLNGLCSTNIKSGCTLVIPYYSAEYQK